METSGPVLRSRPRGGRVRPASPTAAARTAVLFLAGTLLTVVCRWWRLQLAHGVPVDTARHGVLRRVGRELRSAYGALARLFRPARGPFTLPPPRPAPPLPTGPAHASPLPRLLLADALVRRGPPAHPPLAV
ncbi:hypothetical protein AB0B50_26255 [Streptomyces sp. NPDC041068]|uniref:hypothetical protein n=1 Tax=Streptomyces sp. NPDC041068 TaxID=3155130 RepID=UPI0033F2DB41